MSRALFGPYRLERYRSRFMSTELCQRLGALYVASARLDFRNRSDEEHDYLAKEAAAARRNPNKAVGGALARSKQALRRSRHVVAFDGDSQPVAAVQFASNASSRVGGVAGWAAREAKLYLPQDKFITHRYVRIGTVAMMGGVRSETFANTLGAFSHGLPASLNLADAMISFGLLDYDPRQPVSSYPWKQELAAKQTLLRAGLQPTGEARDVFAFGPTPIEPVQQETWRAPSVRAVIDEHLLVMRGAAEFFAVQGYEPAALPDS